MTSKTHERDKAVDKGRIPIRQLRRLPFIGPVTVWHLVKNLGLNVAKPDRHLMRLSNGLGFRDAKEFCSAIAEVSGEDAKVIDLIIWRYLVDTARSGLRRHANQRCAAIMGMIA